MKLPRIPFGSNGLLVAVLVGSIACKSSPSPSTEGPPLDTQAAASETTPEAPLPSAAAAKGPKVVFLGDSLSAGLHLPAEQAFPAVLARKLAAEGAPFRLINAGLSGDTTAGGLRRLDWLLKQDPDVVVVELGANDGFRGLPPRTIQQNLETILERVKAHGARALLLGVHMPPSHGAEYGEAFKAIYPAAAEATSVPVVPFFLKGVAGDKDLNLPDGIHPTPEGHEILAENVAPALRELIESVD